VCARTQRARKRAHLEATLAKEPENAALAAELAQLLLENDANENPIRWTVLKPVVAKSALGATLSILPDGSILASGANPPRDRYVVVLTVDTAIDLAGVRLEALAHPSLPANGPGRSAAGNFAQISWKVSAAPPDRKDPITLQFENAWADRESRGNPIRSDGHWNIGVSQGGDCTAIWELSNRVRLAAATELTFEMQCQTANQFGENLGRFRLSASSDPAALDRDQTRSTASRLTNPWGKLAAAYALNGRNTEALQYFDAAFKQGDGYDDRTPILELAARFDDLLSALIKRQPDDPQLQLAEARKLAQRGKQRLAETQRAKAHADLEQARAIFTRLRASDPVPRWTVLTPVEMKTETGARMELQNDGSIFVHQVQPPANDTYSLVFQPESKGITALRLDVLADSRLPLGGPGWADDGTFVLNELTLQTGPADSPDQARSIALRNATADFSQVSFLVRNGIDGNDKTGWAIQPEVNKDHTAVFELAEELDNHQSSRLTVQLIHRYSTPDRNLGRFRLSFTNDRATLQATRIRLDLKDSELTDCDVALGNAYAQQGRTGEAAAAFVRALEQAPDHASKTRVIATAVSLEGVLEKLTAHAAGDAQFQAELARRLAEQGNPPLAQAARTKARTLFEARLAKEPEDSELATELAQLLFDQRAATEWEWVALKPAETKTESGSKLTLQQDGSLLLETAPATAPETVRWQPGPEPVRALRIEYSTPTVPPTSGAPVFNEYQIVAASMAASRSQTLRGRFVRLDLPADNSQFPRYPSDADKKTINLAELQVFQGDQNIALWKKARQSSDFNGSLVAENAVDGNTVGRDGGGNPYAHTRISSEDATPWWEVDLETEQVIDRIVVWNRTEHGLHTRMNHFRIRVLDHSRKVVFEQVVEKAPNPSTEIPRPTFLAETNSPPRGGNQPLIMRLPLNAPNDTARRFRVSVATRLGELGLEDLRQKAMKCPDAKAGLAAAYAANGLNDQALHYFASALRQADSFEVRKLIWELDTLMRSCRPCSNDSPMIRKGNCLWPGS
jgi:tetratricopeptide (TPR) repeat protein